MNANILPMDVLPIAQPEPVKGSFSHRVAKKHDFEQIGKQDNGIVSQTRRNDTDNSDFQLNSTTQDVKSSDNIDSEAHNIYHKSKNELFEDCLKRHIKTDDSCDEETSSEDTTVGQDIDKIDKPQVQPADELQAIFVASVGQGELADKLPESNQPTQPVAQIEQVMPADNQQKVSQQDALQQGQQVSTDSKNDQNSVQSPIVTDTLMLTVPQKEQTEQTVCPQPRNNGNVPGNVQPKPSPASPDIVKVDVSGNSDGSDKPVESEMPPVAPADAKPVNISSQSAIPLSNQQSAQTIAVSANEGQNIELKISKGQQQGGREQNTNSSKDKSSQDNSDGLLNAQGNRLGNDTTVGGLAAHLSVEKVELVNGKEGTPNSQPVNLTQLVSHGQVADSKSADVIDVSRSTVADAGKSIAGNNASPDESASIREQIYESVQAAVKQGSQQITIQLNPPDLGKVSIKFSQVGAELSGLVETDNPQTRAEIRHAIPEILRSLEQSGVTVKRIDVALSDLSGKSDLSRQSNQESFRDHFSQMAWDRSDSQNYQDSAPRTSIDATRWTIDDSVPRLSSLVSHPFLSDAAVSGLDVLI